MAYAPRNCRHASPGVLHQGGPLKKLSIVLACAALVACVAWGAYVLGWYRGMGHHAVVASMSEARWSLAAAESLRKRHPELALELLEAELVWIETSLRLEPRDVPDQQRGNYEIVLRRLEQYRTEHGLGSN